MKRGSRLTALFLCFYIVFCRDFLHVSGLCVGLEVYGVLSGSVDGMLQKQHVMDFQNGERMKYNSAELWRLRNDSCKVDRLTRRKLYWNGLLRLTSSAAAVESIPTVISNSRAVHTTSRQRNSQNLIKIKTCKNEQSSTCSYPSLLLLNAQKLCTLDGVKMEELRLTATEKKVDIVAVTETWWSEKICTESMGIRNYTCVRTDRVNRDGGGVCVYFLDETLQNETLKSISSDTYSLHFSLVRPTNLKRKKIIFACVYIPPGLKKI